MPFFDSGPGLMFFVVFEPRKDSYKSKSTFRNCVSWQKVKMGFSRLDFNSRQHRCAFESNCTLFTCCEITECSLRWQKDDSSIQHASRGNQDGVSRTTKVISPQAAPRLERVVALGQMAEKSLPPLSVGSFPSLPSVPAVVPTLFFFIINHQSHS